MKHFALPWGSFFLDLFFLNSAAGNWKLEMKADFVGEFGPRLQEEEKREVLSHPILSLSSVLPCEALKRKPGDKDTVVSSPFSAEN